MNVKGKASQAKPVENPYIAARREWNERYGSYIARTRTWQTIGLCSLGLVALLSISLVTLASQSRVQPYIVQVDKLGAAVAVSAAEPITTIDERIIRYQLASFITNARSITADGAVQKKWLKSIYSISTPAAQAYLNEHYKAQDPFEVARSSRVDVEVQSVLKISDKTWQVQWNETRRSLSGGIESSTNWQAVLQLHTVETTTEAQIRANPTGLVIDQINWNQRL